MASQNAQLENASSTTTGASIVLLAARPQVDREASFRGYGVACTTSISGRPAWLFVKNSRIHEIREPWADEPLVFPWLTIGGQIALSLRVMLKIQRSQNGKVVFTLSGRIEAEDVAELKRLFALERAEHHLVLDLKDVTLVDRGAVKFLAQCEADSIKLENCPPYIREWILRQTKQMRRQRQ
jgi:hypothetical protein